MAHRVRWQYRIVSIGSSLPGDNLAIALSYFGQRGWELQTVYDKGVAFFQGLENGFIIFKRPVPIGEEPDGPWTELWSGDQVAHHYEHDL
jgi:hypothetical protein